MTDLEVMNMVCDHMRGSLDRPVATGMSPHLRGLHRETERIAGGMSLLEAADFRKRVGEATDRWFDAMQSALGEVPDAALAPAPPLARRRSGSSYVGRTITRAVIWNTVNSIFRAFR